MGRTKCDGEFSLIGHLLLRSECWRLCCSGKGGFVEVSHRVGATHLPGEFGSRCTEAVRNVGRNAISTPLSFENRRYFRFPEAAAKVNSTFWTASGLVAQCRSRLVLFGSLFQEAEEVCSWADLPCPLLLRRMYRLGTSVTDVRGHR
jgi:hypothetical protein